MSPTARATLLGPRELLLMGGVLLVFAPALVALAAAWSSQEYLSHGYLVPLVSAGLAWNARDRLRETPAGRAPWALPLLALSLAAYALAALAGSVTLQGLALVGAVVAAVAWTQGPARLRILAFPLGFLLFMVPPPSGWITPLIVRLQLFVSEVGIAVLHAFGLPIFREGNVMTLASGEQLFVAEACSGITSIITLLPLGALLAALGLSRLPTRLLLVAAVPVLAMAGNLVRVVGTVVVSHGAGTDAATSGLPHTLLGLSTYAVACGLLLALAAGLRRLEAA